MAKPKCAVVIEKLYSTRMLIIYCDHHAEQAIEIKSIEGVASVTIWEDRLWAYIDPRYDLDEVAAEIEVILTPVEIPEACLEWEETSGSLPTR